MVMSWALMLVMFRAASCTADPAGMHAHVVYQTRNLHAGVLRQIGDQPLIENIAADLVGNPRHYGFHNVGGIFSGTLMGNLAVVEDVVFLLCPAVDLADAAAGVFVQRNIELFDELRPSGLDEPRVVLCVVLA